MRRAAFCSPGAGAPRSAAAAPARAWRERRMLRRSRRRVALAPLDDCALVRWIAQAGRPENCFGDARMRVALVCALVGCAYQPGSFARAPHDFVGQRVTVGCLDIAVERRADLVAGPVLGPVLGYQFGNRCDRPAVVDLGAVAVIGRDPQGADAALRAYDPRHEIRPAALDGRSAGAEVVAYASD